MQPRKDIICVAIDRPALGVNWWSGWPGGGGGKQNQIVHVNVTHPPAPAQPPMYMPHPYPYAPQYPYPYPPQYPPPPGPPTYQYPPPQAQPPPPPEQYVPPPQFQPPQQAQPEEAPVPEQAPPQSTKPGYGARFKAFFKRKPAPGQAPPTPLPVIPEEIIRPPPEAPNWQPEFHQPQAYARPPPPMPESEDVVESKVAAEESRDELDEIQKTLGKIEHTQLKEEEEIERLIKLMEWSLTPAGPPTTRKYLQAWPPTSLRSSSGTWCRCSGQ